MGEPVELSTLQVFWIVVTRHPSWLMHRWVKAFYGPVLVIGGAFGWLAVELLDPLLTLMVIALFAACLIGLTMGTLARMPTRRNPILDLDQYPELRDLIVEAAHFAGLRRAPKVRLRAWGTMLAWPLLSGGTELALGLPLLTELAKDELRAMVTWELLMVGRRSRRDRYVQILYWHHVDQGDLHTRPALAASGLRLWREQRAAVSALIGEESVARWERRQALVAWAFGWHAFRYAAPLTYTDAGFAADVYETFRWKVREDRLLERIAPQVSAMQATSGDPRSGGWEQELAPVTDRVVDALPQKLERGLAKVLAQDLLGGRSLAAGAPQHLLAEVPADAWLSYHQGVRISVLDAAEKVLGRQATGRDIVELVVAGRAEELDWQHHRPCVHPTRGVCALLPFLDVALRGWGYTYAHPFRHREMVGPSGDVINVVELAARVEKSGPLGLDLSGGALSERDPDADARRLAAESLAGDDPTGWFEQLYAEAESGEAIVPWDSKVPHPLLVEWAADRKGAGLKAMVVGCGLGDDAEYVVSLGYDTTAFDVSLSAVKGARARFPDSTVYYQAADLLNPPEEWHHAFDLVVEIMTVQALPEALHERATAAVRDLVAPGGTLLVIASAREEGGPVAAPPWQLTPTEIQAFGTDGLTVEGIEDLREPERYRWRATFRRP